ncbi:MAG: hypothetical protein SCARUB_01764 [Candidatus Scalindua rubra]|uniref:Uncharacterized protein n=1 Tax=Candidatus Scalindua rubra TaxID=1872076 RepID=A0A1E3XBQ8_9BACT|nr:MAG: hypothetical protein SCARUB_01764 [Candidatus Scalindua rubra]
MTRIHKLNTNCFVLIREIRVFEGLKLETYELEPLWIKDEGLWLVEPTPRRDESTENGRTLKP